MKQNIYDNPEYFRHYQALRQTPYNYNNLLEQPAIKSLLPNLQHLQMLDIGCGMGEFAYYCIENHAKHVTAIDVSKNMLAIARREYAHPKIDYCLHAIEDYHIAPESFDGITSSLSLHYIENFDAVIGKIASILRSNGIFIFSIEHPQPGKQSRIIAFIMITVKEVIMQLTIIRMKASVNRHGLWMV